MFALPGPFLRHSLDVGWQEVTHLEFGTEKSQVEYVVLGPLRDDIDYGPLLGRKIYCYVYLAPANDQPERLVRGYFNSTYNKGEGSWFWAVYQRTSDAFKLTNLKEADLTAALRVEMLQKLKTLSLPTHHKAEISTNLEPTQGQMTEAAARGNLTWEQAVFVEQELRVVLAKPTSRSFQDHAKILLAVVSRNFTDIKTNNELYAAALKLHNHFLTRHLMQYLSKRPFAAANVANAIPIDLFPLESSFVRKHLTDLWNYICFLLIQEIDRTNEHLHTDEKVIVELGQRQQPGDLFGITFMSGLTTAPHYDNWNIQVGLEGDAQEVFLWLVKLVSMHYWFQNFPRTTLDDAYTEPHIKKMQEVLSPAEFDLLYALALTYKMDSNYSRPSEQQRKIMQILAEFKRFLYAQLFNVSQTNVDNGDVSLLNLPQNPLDDHAHTLLDVYWNMLFPGLQRYLSNVQANYKIILADLVSIEAARDGLRGNMDASRSKNIEIIRNRDGRPYAITLLLTSWQRLSKRNVLRLAYTMPLTMQDHHILDIIFTNFPIEFFKTYILNILRGLKIHYDLTEQAFLTPNVTTNSFIKLLTTGRYATSFEVGERSNQTVQFEHDFVDAMQHEIVTSPGCFSQIFFKILTERQKHEKETGAPDNFFAPDTQNFKATFKYFLKCVSNMNAENIKEEKFFAKSAPISLLNNVIDALKGEHFKFFHQWDTLHRYIALKILRIHNAALAFDIYGSMEIIEHRLAGLYSSEQHIAKVQVFLREVFDSLGDKIFCQFVESMRKKQKEFNGHTHIFKHLPVDVIARMLAVAGSSTQMPIRASQSEASSSVAETSTFNFFAMFKK